MFFQPVKTNPPFSGFKDEYNSLLEANTAQPFPESLDEARHSITGHNITITGETEGIDKKHLNYIAQVDPLNKLIGYWQNKFGLEKPQAINEAKRNIIKRDERGYGFIYQNRFTFKKEGTLYPCKFIYYIRFNESSFFQPSIFLAETSLPYFAYLGKNDVMSLSIDPIFNEINALLEQYHAQKSVFFSNSELIKSTRAQIMEYIHLILGPLLARGVEIGVISELEASFNEELDRIFNVAPCVLHCR